MSRAKLSKADRLLLTIVLLLAAVGGLAAWLMIPPEKSGNLLDMSSTFYNVGSGAKVSYEVLQRLDVSVNRLRRPIDATTLERTGVLFVLRPFISLAPHEVAALDKWVQAGHALVIVPPYGLELSCSSGQSSSDGEAAPARLRDWFDLTDITPPDKKESPPSKVFDRNSVAWRPIVQATPTKRSGITAGIQDLATRGNHRFAAKTPLRGPLEKLTSETFWSDEHGIVGLQVAYGSGTIIALADAYPFTNLGIGDYDNALLLANIVQQMAERYPGNVTFDEYHFNFIERDITPVAVAKLALGGKWRWASIQAVIVLMLAVYLGAVRFGTPKDIERIPRRHHREYAEAAGRLLREAHGNGIAARTVFRHYREQLCRAMHLDSSVDNRLLGRAVRERLGSDITDILEQAERASYRSTSPHKLVMLFRELHRTVEALTHAN